MKFIKIEKKSWANGLEKLRDGYRLIGPVEDKDSFEFKELKQGQEPNLKIQNTRLSAKSAIYPRTQAMFEYTLDETQADHHLLKEVNPVDKQQVVLGIRPCDASSFLLVKRNFDNPEYPDPYWVKPYENTTFVGLACEDPRGTCFCTSVGCGPYNEAGLDLLLIEDGDDYIAKALTSKGEELAKAAGWNSAVKKFDEAARKKQAESKIKTSVPIDKLGKIAASDLFEAPFWDDVGFSCLNCGTCTYSCPTCWCFDIQEEVSGQNGKRMRNWDSCMYPLFTLEGSGHNPRPEKTQRVRQRFMHKLKYYLDKHQAEIQCVGCGRCIQLCPVNIDIRSVCEKMNSL